MNSLSLSAAQRVADAAIAAAQAHGVAACIAVCDPAGEPIVTLRMDGAPRLSADIALNKAYTVASFNGLPTHEWWPASPTIRRWCTASPTLPLDRVRRRGSGTVDGALVGAVGVSGGSAEQDREIAEAGAAAVGDS